MLSSAFRFPRIGVQFLKHAQTFDHGGGRNLIICIGMYSYFKKCCRGERRMSIVERLIARLKRNVGMEY